MIMQVASTSAFPKSVAAAAKAAETIDGWLSDREGRYLFYQAAAAASKGAVVEIGSWLGKSTTWLAFGARCMRGRVYAIDPHLGSPEHHEMWGEINTYEKFMKNMNRIGMKEYVVALRNTSANVARKWSEPVAFVFIDGNHDEPEVEADFSLWWDKLIEGGVIALHDSTYNFGARLPGWTGPRHVANQLFHRSDVKDHGFVDSITYATKCASPSTGDSVRAWVVWCAKRATDFLSWAWWNQERLPIIRILDPIFGYFGFADYFAMKGQGASRSGDWNKAIRYFERALDIDPDDFWTRYHICEILLRSDRPDLARPHLEYIATHTPTELKQLRAAGILLIREGMFKNVIPMFESLCVAGSNDSWDYFNLGYALRECNRFNEALEALSQAAYIDSSNVGAHHQLALIRMIQHNWEKAAADLANALLVDPYHEPSLLDIIRVHLHRKDVEGASLAMEKARTRIPHNPEITVLEESLHKLSVASLMKE